MNDTPTPRTDELRKQLWEKSWSNSYMIMMTHANRLERELAAVTEQRDNAREDSIRWMSIAEGRGRTDDEGQLSTPTQTEQTK